MGTGEIGNELFLALKKDTRFELACLVTGPDKPMGRKMVLTPPKIKEGAEEMGVEVFQPTNINELESIEKIKAYGADFIVVMAYGQLLTEAILNTPKIDCLNCHTSLLPKYRGASPIQTALLNGDQETGISLMRMVKKMDAGAVYEKFKLSIQDENAEELSQKLAILTAKKVPEAIIKIAKGELKATEQDEVEVSYVKKISKAEGHINWNESAEVICRKVRAFYPWPSTYSFMNEKRLKILKAEYNSEKHHQPPGTITKQGIACKEGYLVPEIIQPEGKKPQAFLEFLNGNHNAIGAKLA